MGVDITYLFRELSRSKREELKIPPIDDSDLPKSNPDRLTQECLEINSKVQELRSYLAKIRPMYLSNTRSTRHNDSLTDEQRDDIDYETRLILQQQMGRLRMLEELEKKRLEKLTYNNSAFTKFLRDPKKEGIDKTIELHRTGMFWYLNDSLKQVSDIHAAQQEIRLSRQLEKSKSTFHNIPEISLRRATTGSSFNSFTTPAIADDDENDSGLGDLSSHQIQQLEQENDSLLQELELTYDKVRQAEKSMYEISELQTNLATHLSTQNDKIQSLLDDAFKTSSDVTAANEQLSSARKRNRRASKMIIYSSVTLGMILLFYDSMLG